MSRRQNPFALYASGVMAFVVSGLQYVMSLSVRSLVDGRAESQVPWVTQFLLPDRGLYWLIPIALAATWIAGSLKVLSQRQAALLMGVITVGAMIAAIAGVYLATLPPRIGS